METNCWTTNVTLTWCESETSCKELLLLEGETKAGQLTRHGWSGSDAELTTPVGSWMIRSRGFWGQHLVITDAKTGKVVSECGSSWTGAKRTIRWFDGRVYTWRQAGAFSEDFELTGPAGEVLLVTTVGGERWSWREMFRTNGRVEVRNVDPGPARLALLSGLSWLFLLKFREEAAGAVVIMS